VCKLLEVSISIACYIKVFKVASELTSLVLSFSVGEAIG
jgi:hypothetical protein